MQFVFSSCSLALLMLHFISIHYFAYRHSHYFADLFCLFTVLCVIGQASVLGAYVVQCMYQFMLCHFSRLHSLWCVVVISCWCCAR